jgi:Protein of unknown function (DUF1493)
MTSECGTDVSLEENVLTFVSNHWLIPRRHKLSVKTRLAQDLGMDGDDAVKFFKDFGHKFNVDFADLHIRWNQHFAPEGGGSFGVVVVLCLCVTAGFWLHDTFGLVAPWGWGIVLIGAAILVHRRWFANDTMLSITVEDLVESARLGRWTKSYPDSR